MRTEQTRISDANLFIYYDFLKKYVTANHFANCCKEYV